MKRPSGAELLPAVVKRGMDPHDAALQCSLIEKAGALSIPILAKMFDGYVMARGADLPATMYPALYRTFEQLWAMPNPRRVVTLSEYHAYVVERAMTSTRPLVLAALARLQSSSVVDDPNETCFTHGDANLSNALLYEGQVRLIDFSPRPTPPDPDLDRAKLLLSATGFDNDAPAIALRALSSVWSNGWEVVDGELRIKSSRLQYYYLTHIIRVATRDPSHDEFFLHALRSHL